MCASRRTRRPINYGMSPTLFSFSLASNTKCNSLPLRRANARRAPRARSLFTECTAARRATITGECGLRPVRTLSRVLVLCSHCVERYTALMHPNADTTNKAGLICSQIYQVTRIQCELSGRRDSGAASRSHPFTHAQAMSPDTLY